MSPSTHLEARKRETAEVHLSKHPSLKTTNLLFKPRKKIIPSMIPRRVPLATRSSSSVNQQSSVFSSQSFTHESPAVTPPIALLPHPTHIIQSQLTQRSYHNHKNISNTIPSSQFPSSTQSFIQHSANSSPRDDFIASNETVDDVLFHSSNDATFLVCSTEAEHSVNFHDSLNTTSLYDSSHLAPSSEMDFSFTVSASGSPSKHTMEEIPSDIFLKPKCLTWTQKQSTKADRGSVQARNNEIFYCPESRCTLTFTSTHDLSLHYATVHRFECSLCHRHAGLLSSFHLERHLLEQHDSFFRAQADRQPMYVCLLEGCCEVFKTAFVRDRHCVTAHHFPQNFCFASKNSRGPPRFPKKASIPTSRPISASDASMCDSDNEPKS